MDALGGKVTRRSASDVYAEVVATEDADFQEGVDALKARIHEHRADRKENWQAFKEKVESRMT
jgi:adenosyl cobinamide kinase/adenosyl cobinamide phosphate guanylyltransferase